MSLLARFQLQGGSSFTGASGGPSGIRGRSSFRSPLRSPSRSLSPTLDDQTPPPNQAACRQRSDSTEQVDAEHQRLLKRQKKYALDVSREYQLEDDALEEFAKLPLPQMLIRIYGKLIAIERAREKDEYYVFIHSEAFKEILKDRLRSCLLSPNLTCYLDGLPDNIWKFMNKSPQNLALFKIPKKALDEPGIPDFIDSLMKDILTKQRAMIKNKIGLSIKSKQHISLLAKALVQTGYYEVTASQWARFAFLRKSYVTFEELVMESMAKTVHAMSSGQSGDASAPTQCDNSSECNDEGSDTTTRDWVRADFWEYVDGLLGDLRAAVAENDATLDEQKKLFEEFFTGCLQEDLTTYRATKRNIPVPQASTYVLSDWQRAIHQDLVWS